MYPERRKGMAYSVAFHLLLIILIVFGLPTFLEPPKPYEPMVITVAVLPISKISNVKNSDAKQAEKETEEPEPEQKKPAPPVKTAETEPTPPEPAPVEKPEPKPEIKKPEPKKEEKKPEPKPEPKKAEPKKEQKKPKNDLDAILESVRETAQKEKTEEKKEPHKEKTAPTPKAQSEIYDASKSLSLSEMDAIRGQYKECWIVPTGAKNARDLDIYVNVEFGPDGSYMDAQISDKSMSRYNSDTIFRAAADSALRAVRKCSPLKNLPSAKYDNWRYMELHFDPKDML